MFLLLWGWWGCIAEDPVDPNCLDKGTIADFKQACASARPGSEEERECQELDCDGDGVSALADCDDGNAGVHPGAAEVCGDLLDRDCDGDKDDCS